jgi:fucose permease
VGLWSLGLSAGGLASSLLHALSTYYTSAPAQAINSTGTLFGSGCALATAAVGTTYFAGSVQLEVGLLAIVPFVFLFVLWRTSFAPARVPFDVSPADQKKRDALRDLRSVAAVLFSLLLFFQFGNEWVLAGWLPIFLIHRLGANPAGAIFILAMYFAALTASRLAVRQMLPHVSHRRLLNWGMLIAISGFALISWTPAIPGACVAVILIGAGYAPIYPVIAETLDHRFSFHPGFYQGLFSIAITGAMSLPWLVGYVDNMLGTEYIMLLPALGSLVVLVLALLIRLEARLMGSSDRNNSSIRVA